MMTHIISSFPSYYYLKTRYKYAYERMFYSLKYWGVYFFFFYITGIKYNVELAALLLLSLANFYNIYDLFTYFNDTVSVKKEDNPLIRNNNNLIPNIKSYYFYKALHFFIITISIFLINIDCGIYNLAALVSLSIFYWTHNNLEPRFRIATYYLLYVLKGLLFAFIYYYSYASNPVQYIMLVLLFNFSYAPKYFLRKTLGYKIQSYLFQPIVWKNILLLSASMWYGGFIYIILFIDVLTLIEYFYQKKVKRINISEGLRV